MIPQRAPAEPEPASTLKDGVRHESWWGEARTRTVRGRTGQTARRTARVFILHEEGTRLLHKERSGTRHSSWEGEGLLQRIIDNSSVVLRHEDRSYSPVFRPVFCNNVPEKNIE